MKKYINIYICMGLIVGILLMFIYNPGVKEFTKTSAVMGTFLTVTSYSKDITEELTEEAKRLEKIFSLSIPDSELNYINENAANGFVEVSNELYECTKIALEWCEKSNGALDISIGKLIDLWGIGTENARVPDDSEIEKLKNVSYKDIILNEKERTIFFKNDNVKLNLGAVAKGYACDMMAKQTNGFFYTYSALINLGGNICCCNPYPRGNYWKIGITDPFNSLEVIMIKEIQNEFQSIKSVVTSGDYERYFEENGIRYHHIIDPKTGYPARSGLKSVTVIGDNSAICDALSTAIFISGDFTFLPDDYHLIAIYDSGEIYEK